MFRSIVWRWKGESTPKKINVACPRVWCTKYSLVLWIVLLLWCCEVLSESPPAWRKSEGWLVPKAAVYTRLLTTITTRGEESPGLSTVKSRHCSCLDFDRTQSNSVWRGGTGWHQDGNQYPESTPLHCIVHWGQRQHKLTPNTSIDKNGCPKMAGSILRGDSTGSRDKATHALLREGGGSQAGPQLLAGQRQQQEEHKRWQWWDCPCWINSYDWTRRWEKTAHKYAGMS